MTTLVEDAISIICRHGLHREIHLGHSFISSLDQSVASDPDVNIVAADFYRDWAFYEHAQTKIQHQDIELALHNAGSLLDEHLAGLALLKALVEFFQKCRYTQAIEIAQQIERIYVGLTGESKCIHDEAPGNMLCFLSVVPVDSDQEQRLAILTCQADLWARIKAEDYYDVKTPISDNRVSRVPLDNYYHTVLLFKC
jgi:hypothetical protein